MGLNDMILLKGNHLRAAGGLSAAVGAVRENLASGAAGRLLIETEVTTLSEVEEGLDCEVDWLLLDNMSVSEMRRAVALRDERGSSTQLEASGNIDLANISAVSTTGIDAVAVGSVTHSAPALDLSMLIVSVGGTPIQSSFAVDMRHAQFAHPGTNGGREMTSDDLAVTQPDRSQWTPELVIFDCDGVLVDSEKIASVQGRRVRPCRTGLAAGRARDPRALRGPLLRRL